MMRKAPWAPARRRARSWRRNGSGLRGQLLEAHVPGADRDGLGAHLVEETAVGVHLLVLRGPAPNPSEEVLGPEEADALGSVHHGGGCLLGELDVGAQTDRDPVTSHGGQVARALEPLFLAPLAFLGRAERLEHGAGRLHHYLATGPVHDEQAPGRNAPGGVLERHHGGDAEGARDDRGVVGGRAGVGDHRQDALPVHLRRFRGRQVGGHQDERAGQPGEGRRVLLSGQIELDPAQDVVEVGRPLAEVDVGEGLEEAAQLLGDGP
jgi:hypothetical protein